MKKFKGFTLLESLAVIGIIGVISVALFNMKNIGKDYADYRKEAVNIIYKEIEHTIKDFQRNKIWKDSRGNEHEIDSFQIKFTDKNGENTGAYLEIGNTYIYCLKTGNIITECLMNASGELENGIELGSGYFESEVLISGGNFEIKKNNIKNIEQYKYYVNVNNNEISTTNAINIGKLGEIFVGDNITQHASILSSLINDTSTPLIHHGGVDDKGPCTDRYDQCMNNTTLTDKERQYIQNQNNGGLVGSILRLFGINIGNSSVTENATIENKIKKCLGNSFYEICGGYLNDIVSINVGTTNTVQEVQIYTSIIISAKQNDGKCENVGKITINSVTKNVSLDRCNNDREKNGIYCGTEYCQ